MPITFTTYDRVSLASLSDVEQRTLADTLRTYATAEIVAEHHLANGGHGLFHGHASGHVGLPGTGTDFFMWHRAYLGACERAIGRRLPYWRPWQKIPPAFLEPEDQRGRVRDPKPPVKEVEFLPFSSERVWLWRDADALGTLLSWGPHLRTHFACGGDMADVPRAPAAPIFWCWHAFLDDIYEDWRRRRVFGALPVDWPWLTQPPLPSLGTAVGSARVPLVWGARRSKAVALLVARGLDADVSQLPHPWSRVVAQRPLPFSPVRPGETVFLSGAARPDWPQPV